MNRRRFLGAAAALAASPLLPATAEPWGVSVPDTYAKVQAAVNQALLDQMYLASNPIVGFDLACRPDVGVIWWTDLERGLQVRPLDAAEIYAR